MTKKNSNIHQEKLTIMEYKELQKFIEALVKTGAPEIKIETEEIRVIVRNQLKANQTPVAISSVPAVAPVAQPAAPAQQSTPEVAPETADDASKYVEIKSPMVGTFYRKPSPDKPAYINIGDDISEGSVLCTIEAMKLFNEIESEVNGKIVKVLVEDASPVEYDQPLFLVEPF
ncbi:MAG: acetyl-CoA carboxylase biotin carboxyl carrier protein [Bacteroidales bacterium]|nr:acetyl-CoA carboxylase biotin carboxyl carrier protein [Bacteroidales bacterium]